MPGFNHLAYLFDVRFPSHSAAATLFAVNSAPAERQPAPAGAGTQLLFLNSETYEQNQNVVLYLSVNITPILF